MSPRPIKEGSKKLNWAQSEKIPPLAFQMISHAIWFLPIIHTEIELKLTWISFKWHLLDFRSCPWKKGFRIQVLRIHGNFNLRLSQCDTSSRQEGYNWNTSHDIILLCIVPSAMPCRISSSIAWSYMCIIWKLPTLLLYCHFVSIILTLCKPKVSTP